jgi:hypothetical protein
MGMYCHERSSYDHVVVVGDLGVVSMRARCRSPKYIPIYSSLNININIKICYGSEYLYTRARRACDENTTRSTDRPIQLLYPPL